VRLADQGDYYLTVCAAAAAIATRDLAQFMKNGQATVYIN
jgi:hypothetical protein